MVCQRVVGPRKQRSIHLWFTIWYRMQCRIQLKDFDPRHGRFFTAKLVDLAGILPQLVSNLEFGSRTSTPDTGDVPQLS